ncbi:AI-2E family transporter [Deinococcus lacus]|uniref:AI-2E family transporter n=1 Tax=Deinococcus lacus TaxID=392561 RepID=A0ABW1YBZ4_9DEIO
MIAGPKELNAFQYAWRSPWVRLAVFLAAGYLVYHFTAQVAGILANFMVAYLIAYVANPMLKWLERRRIGRGLGVLFVLLLFAGILAMAGVLLTTVATQLVDLVRSLPALLNSLDSYLNRLAEWLTARGVENVDQMRQDGLRAAQEYVNNITGNLLPLLQNLLRPDGALLGGLLSIGGWLGRLLIITLLSVYLMLDYSRINASLLRMLPRPWQPRVLEFSDLAGQAIGGYVRGQLLIALFIGVAVSVGLSIIGVPSALAIGFLAGIFNIIPYLGPIIGAVPAILLSLPFGWLKPVLAVAVFVIANQIEGSFLSPMILSKTTDLHPVTVLLSILIGASLFGFVGALVAVPLVALGKLMLEKYYYSSRVYTEGP